MATLAHVPMRPLHSLITGKVIPDFPVTTQDITALDPGSPDQDRTSTAVLILPTESYFADETFSRAAPILLDTLLVAEP